jgi:hypothetical protein
VKLREKVRDFPETPKPTRTPRNDLIRLQEWCIECEKIADDLLARVRIDQVERPLCLLRELGRHLKSGYPPIDETVYDRIRSEVWNELEKLVKVIEDLDEPETMTILKVTPTAQFEFKAEHWINRAMSGQDYEPLLKKLKEHRIYVPDDQRELVDMISAAGRMAKTDWDRVNAICEGQNSGKAARIPMDELAERMSVLNVAKLAEEKIRALVLKRYRRENPRYDKAFVDAEDRVVLLYNEAAEALNSNETLGTVSYLRDNQLEAGFKRLHDSLFKEYAFGPDPYEALQEMIDELEAVREQVRKAGGEGEQQDAGKDIWQDILPDMKEAIQEYWKESKAQKSNHRRLTITGFCEQKGLDEKAFRSEKDRVEKRKNRPGWADQ